VRPASRILILLALSGAALGAAWWGLRPADAPPGTPAPAAEPPRVATRHPVEPRRPLASLAPEEEASAARRTWVELNNEATDDLGRGDLALAVEKLARCHEAEPANHVYLGNLVEALVRLARLEHEEGRLELAVGHLERAVQLGEARTDLDVLQRLLERWKRELELEQDDRTEGSYRFDLTYDTDRSDILHHSFEVLELLERCYEDLVAWFEADPLQGQHVRVVLYDPEDFDRLTGLGDWAAGVFDGVVRVSVRDLLGSNDWRFVLRHELVHAFVQAQAGNAVPGWLNEGLAQALEERPLDRARLEDRLAGQPLFTLDQLEGSLAGWQDPKAIGRAYAQSLLFVDYLRTTYGDGALRRMVQGARDPGIAGAFRAWSSVPLEVAFSDWADARAR